MQSTIKHKKCKAKGCNKQFTQWSSTQVACSMPCAVELVREKDAKETRKQNKARLLELEPISYWFKKAQIEFNRFIRLRDASEPCISCQRDLGGKMNAGHYKTVGAHPELRFDEDNCHKQCEYCNTHKSANLIEYRIHLVSKIGLDRVERLEGPMPPKHYTIPDVRDIRDLYKQKCKELT